MAICGSCGRDNPEGFRFCGFCTAPLGESEAHLGEERKVVTVLFCDLVGFTSASDRADAEDVRARLHPYHIMLRREIEAFGGTVEKFIGDAVMAVFGAPLAHEDDAERAVRAGVRILEAVRDLNEQSRELDLKVRIGINTGEAVVSLGARPERGEGIVTGDVVNTAARLETVAPTNAVVVGEDTYRASSRIFDYEPLPAVSVKGKSQPLALWRAKAARARFGSDILRTHATPLVGRDVELSILRGTFDRAVRDSSFQLVTIVGEPGVGKSRLVAELFAYTDSLPTLVTWRQGRCLPYGQGVTFWALGEIVKAQAGIFESDDPATTLAKLEAAIEPSERDREWLKARLSPLVGTDVGSAGTVAREEVFTAWRKFLESVASTGPAVFVIEDLHWADETMLEFAGYLAEWVEGVPMLLVCVTRPELFERHPNWAGGKRNATTINLEPLSEQETARLVAALLERAVLPAETQALLIQQSGGNPLYAEEFFRMLTETGALDEWGRLLGSPDSLRMPDTVQALIAARLDALSADLKGMLQDASVIGKVFWSGGVVAMGQRGEQAVSLALHELSRKEFLRPARVSSIEGETEYAFWHALLRDVSYGQIPRAERASKHLGAASWIEQISKGRVEDVAEILAHHYQQALTLQIAAGGEVTKARNGAVRNLTLAGDRAMSLDVASAEAHFARALELASPDHADRPSMLVRWAEALRQRGRYKEAADAFERAIEAFRSVGDIRSTASAMSKYSILLFALGDTRYGELAREAVSSLEGLPPSEELAIAYSNAAGSAYVAGENDEAVMWADKAVGLAQRLGLPEPARAIGFRGGALSTTGDPQGIVDMRRALDLAMSQGLGREAALLYNNVGVDLILIEGPPAALTVFEEGIEFSKRRGVEEFVLVIGACALAPLIEGGNFERALAQASEMTERLEPLGAADLVLVRRAEALVQLRRGNLSTVSAVADWLARTVAEMRDVQSLGTGYPIIAMVRLAQGDGDLAVSLLKETLGVPHVSEHPLYVMSFPDMLRTALATGDEELARELQSGLQPTYAYHRCGLLTGEALLAEHERADERSVELFGQAEEGWRKLGAVWEEAQAMLGRGRALVRLGRASDAIGPISEAREVFVGLGARPAREETDSLLERAIARTS